MLDFFGAIGGAIMAPLYYVISAVLVGFHKLFGALFGEASGTAGNSLADVGDRPGPRTDQARSNSLASSRRDRTPSSFRSTRRQGRQPSSRRPRWRHG